MTMSSVRAGGLLASLAIIASAAIVASATPAEALEACFADSVGAWRGPVLSDDALQDMDTVFTLQDDGTLAGTYHVARPEPYDGTLTDFRKIGKCEAEFVWHDRYGHGVVHIRFAPAVGRFRGEWGGKAPQPGWRFDGDRRTGGVVS